MTKQQDTQVEKNSPLLATKLNIPSLHQSLIPRPRLAEQLDQIFNYKVILVSAPAGYGKTTLLSQWLTTEGAERLRDRAAWVSLENDLDLHRFCAYIFQAFETLGIDRSEGVLAGFDSPGLAIETDLPAFINSITAVPEQFLLILDDCDMVEDQAVHTVVASLLESLPSNLHLIISTRIDPPIALARLRLTGEMLELRAADLAFTPGEAGHFLNQGLGLSLSVEEVAALAKRTEGWIAGLHAAALSLQGRQDPSAFIQTFTGSQRYVMDFLVEEVLQRQSEPIQAFLLKTAVLDRLCGSLCDAVTGRSDSQGTLAWLEKANLFIVPLDDQRQWYRYHKLFSDVLRQRLLQSQPGKVAEFHRLASEWYERNNMLEKAVEHALDAQAYTQAEGLIERVISVRIGRPGGLNRVIRWLERLPEEIRRENPQLNLWYSTEKAKTIDPLSKRELEVLRLMAVGASNQEIADALSIAMTTAKKHVSNILLKLKAANRTEVVARGRDLGLLS